MKAAVLVFPGSNCDRDLAVALERAGADVSMVWHKETALPEGLDFVGIGKGHTTLALQTRERFIVGKVIAIVMRDWDLDLVTLGITRRKRRIRRLDLQSNGAADILKSRIAT